jgi:radical SAM protein with 4Fe4S-binding SPASM domain
MPGIKKITSSKSLKENIKSTVLYILREVPLLPFEAYFGKKILTKKFQSFGIEPTNICNANCSFCSYKYVQREKCVMDNTLFQAVIEDFSGLGGGNLNITPTVGEVLVDKDIIQKIEFCAKYPNIQDFFFYTNAILLNRFDMKRILVSGLKRMSISTFLGDSKRYKEYYGRDKYETVIRNITNITKMNRELGSPVNILLHLRCEKPFENIILSEDYKKVTQYIPQTNVSFLEEYDTWYGISQKDLPTGAYFTSNPFLKQIDKNPCSELYRRLHVYSDGSVGVCVCRDINCEIQIGNIRNETLKNIWQGEKLANLRREWFKGQYPAICKECTRYKPLSIYMKERRLDYLSGLIRLFSNITKKFRPRL